jgi:hypothetical protein
MRTLGAILATAGIVGATSVPLLGFPGAFALLMAAALVLWFAGIAAAAVCLAPARPVQGTAGLMAAMLGWPLVLLYGTAPLWGLLAAACGGAVSGVFPTRLRAMRRAIGNH